jgi:DNA-binding PadR family transcriptional regulator
VEVLIRLLGQAGALRNAEIRTHLGLKDRTHLRERYLDSALADGVIEPTIPEKPNGRLQKYRLTAKGAALLASLSNP